MMLAEHVGAGELFCLHVVEVLRFVVDETSAQLPYAVEMGVEPAAAYLVAAGFGHDCFAATYQQRAEHHHAAAQLSATLDERRAAEVLVVEPRGGEGVVVLRVLHDLHPHVAQQLYLVVYVGYIRDVLDANRFAGEQDGA